MANHIKMIELYISSHKSTSRLELAKLLQHTECQITDNYSSVICPGQTQNVIEQGYYIKFFDIKPDDFKEKVWNIIQPILELKCAYVKADSDYMGCVLNWPVVFTPSNCFSQEIKKNRLETKYDSVYRGNHAHDLYHGGESEP
jgi:hypothetical protein